jgi:hypothetical protein
MLTLQFRRFFTEICFARARVTRLVVATRVHGNSGIQQRLRFFPISPVTRFLTTNNSTMHASNDPTVKATLSRLIKKNHDEFDITFNNYLANHMVHHLYALYALGGTC